MQTNGNGNGPAMFTLEWAARMLGYPIRPKQPKEETWEASAKRVRLIQQFQATEMTLKHLHTLKLVMCNESKEAERDIQKCIEVITLIRQAIGTKYGMETLKRDCRQD